MKWTVWMVAIATVGGLSMLSASVAAHPNSCTTTTMCAIECHQGDILSIKLQYYPAEWQSGNVRCGGVELPCTGTQATNEPLVCTAVTPVLFDDVGPCRLFQGGTATCANYPQ